MHIRVVDFSKGTKNRFPIRHLVRLLLSSFFFFPFSRLGPQAFPPLPLEEFAHVKAFTQDLAEAVDVQDFKKIKEQLRRSKRY
jgi:hypothetical protein